MRVLINQLTALRHKAGIGHYIEQLIGGLREEETDATLLPYPSGVTETALTMWQQWSRRGHSTQAPGASPGWKHLASGVGRRLAEWNFRLFARARRFDLYHEPNFIPYPCDRPTIATIHDLSLLLHPEWHPAERVRHHERNVARALDQCRHFIAVSDFTRHQAIEHLGLPPERVSCVPNGFRTSVLNESQEGEARFRQLGLPATYLLHVGTLEPRKNLLMLMKAYCALPAELREHCPLVLAGGWGWNVRELADYYHQEAKHKHVIHLGYVTEELLGSLYRGARALLVPSHYEGFGLPALEMLALGGTVLCSSAAALKEVVGDQGYFLDPEDADGWHEALARLVTDESWADWLRPMSSEPYRDMTWQRCARDTFAAYQRALETPTRSIETTMLTHRSL